MSQVELKSNQTPHIAPSILLVLNGFALAPFGLFLCFIAFAGDYDAFPTLGYGLLYAAIGIATSVIVFTDTSKKWLQIVCRALILLHLIVLIRGVSVVLSRPDVVQWPEHLLLASPLIVVPIASLAFLGKRCVFGKSS